MTKIKKYAPYGLFLLSIFSFLMILWHRFFSYEEIYVLKRDLPARHALVKDDLKKKKVPKALVDDSIAKKESDFKDRVVALEHSLYRDLPIPKKALEKKEGAEFLLKEGEVALSLNLNLRNNLGNSLRVGHRVDVHLQPRREGLSSQIAEAVRVIGLRNRRGEEVGKDDFADVVLLAVDKDYVSMFLDAEAEGDLILSLNPKLHEETRYLPEGAQDAR